MNSWSGRLVAAVCLGLFACEESGLDTPAGSGGAAGVGGGFPTGGFGPAGGSGGVAGNAGFGGMAGMAGMGGDTGGTGGVITTGGSGGPDVDGGTGLYQVDPIGNANRAPGFVDLSPPMGTAFSGTGDVVTPAPPAGWIWYDVEGTKCRDGSPAGLYVHEGTTDKLLIYLEGGGACSNDHYCAFNPASVNQVLAGDGQVVIGSTLGAGAGRQQPGVYTDANHAGPPAGIFDTSNAANPFKDWSQIYIPYCTGDVHFGTRPNAMVPNLATPQQFVGYLNMQKFIGRIVPTYRDEVSQVAIAGSSAGGFGVALNYSMVQDAFGDVPVLAIDDSGPPFVDMYMPACMQKRWRETWGLNDALPPDCTECFDAGGGNIIHLADFLMRKHPSARLALISSMNDEVIRLFFSVGLVDCKNYDTADPVATVLFQADPTVFFPAAQYEGGLNALRSAYEGTGQFATYYIGGPNITFHEHLFRPRFFQDGVASKTVAKFVSDFLGGAVEQVGP